MPFSKKSTIASKQNTITKEDIPPPTINPENKTEVSIPGQIGPSTESPNYKQLVIALESVRNSTQ